jgi:hypothetical protein
LKYLLIFILLSTALYSCNNKAKSDSIKKTNLLEIKTAQEEEAMEALTKLQLNADIENSIYLTFGNTNHNQLPSDSSFTISQKEFKTVLLDYTAKHHENTSEEKRMNWVEASIQAQMSYNVYYCRDKSKKAAFKNGLPYSGAWILPSVLNKDIVLIWRR